MKQEPTGASRRPAGGIPALQGREDVNRLHIDWTRCDGRGLCTELLPDLLTRDDWGYPLSRNRSREPEIPDELSRFAKEAVKRCPRLALRLISE